MQGLWNVFYNDVTITFDIKFDTEASIATENNRLNPGHDTNVRLRRLISGTSYRGPDGGKIWS